MPKDALNSQDSTPVPGQLNPEAQAAVCLIRCKDQSVPNTPTRGRLLLIQRAKDPRDPWSGHFSFPGGMREAGETLLQNALRECQEEIGLDLRSHVATILEAGIAGRAQGRSLLVQAFWFEIQTEPQLFLQASEVARTLWLDLDHFCQMQNHSLRQGLTPLAPERAFPGYALQGGFLWGFSYGVLCQALGLPISMGF
jgi:8-oxo-dGTP diphosphatase